METHDAGEQFMTQTHDAVEFTTQTHDAVKQFMTEAHDAAEQFQCIICLELVYKPIVHACGHLFCFWCVHRAMNGAYKNLCPLCRRPYMHFPRICEQLHFLLLKAVRDKYLIRAKEVLEEEAQGGVFSPELSPQPPRSRSQETPPEKAFKEASSTTDTETVSTSNGSSEGGSVCLSNSSSNNGDDPSPSTKETDLVSFKGKAPMADESETNLGGLQEPPANAETLDTSLSNFVTVSDLACLHCGNLLYRPVVLNCGHMFCEHCVVVGENDSVSCPSCKAEHPGIFPQVCLELHHYIDRIFPLEYAQRSLRVASEERDRPRHRPQLPPSEPEDSIKGRIRKPLPGPVHRTIGCDGCGMMPIVGKRFQCQDCPEAIGFDLCGKCHDSGIVLGRFNQGHTSEHRMVEVRRPSRGSSIARRFLAVMANRSLNIMDDLRAIAHDCNEAEAFQVLLAQQPVDGNGTTVSQSADTAAQATTTTAPSLVEEDGAPGDGDGVLHDGDYILQDGDGEDHHDGFLHNGGDDGEFDGQFDGQDDDEFEAFSRDDEDVNLFRVVFHS